MDEDYISPAASRGFEEALLLSPFNVMVFIRGRLSVAPNEPRLPEWVKSYKSHLVPYIGLLLRIDEVHYVVKEVVCRLDLDCFLVLVDIDREPQPGRLPRHFTDGTR